MHVRVYTHHGLTAHTFRPFKDDSVPLHNAHIVQLPRQLLAVQLVPRVPLELPRHLHGG